MVVTRALPGIVFRTETPPQVALPRMDVAAFVGFARSGPLHTPVPIEDMAQFRDLFGDPMPLAWDEEVGAWQIACLSLAVADFFAQGGRRCWVVRVAGNAVTNTFPITGLLRADAGGNHPAFARARSPGSASDDLQVASSLLVDALAFAPLWTGPTLRLEGNFTVAREAPLQPGDVLQLKFSNGLLAYLHVEMAEFVANGSFNVEGEARWFRPLTGEDAPITGAISFEVESAVVPNVTLSRSEDSLELTPFVLPAGVQPRDGLGEWLILDTPTERIWMIAEKFLSNHVSVRAAWEEVYDGAPALLLTAARINLALETQSGDSTKAQLRDLALGAPHPRFWGYLPDDTDYFRVTEGFITSPQGEPGELLRREAVLPPRFPLASEREPSAFYIPLGLEGTSFVWRGALPVSGSALERDGLVPQAGVSWGSFLQDIYLDANLRNIGENALIATAVDLRFTTGVTLSGIHSILPISEVSMLALPDVVHRGWSEQYALPFEPPVDEPPPSPKECEGHDVFTTKIVGLLPPPPAVPPLVIPPPETRWTLRAGLEYEVAGDAEGLLEIQQRAAELASARADLVAILGMPSHYRTREAHVHRLALQARLAGRLTTSYVSLTHPWLVERDSMGALQRVGADGVMCGMMAHRARTRGAWVAPANQVARNALALTPEFSREENIDLFLDGINLFRNDVRGAVLWSSSTLSDDEDYAALNVRRLLILLRRVALREGDSYVFEPHSPAFQRQVASNLERLLTWLFERGAFAGKDPTEAYQVVTDSTVNIPTSVEQGRFIVELRIAPALPLTFIVVRLLESGGSFVVQEG